MAQIQKVIITDYPDGSRVMSNIRNKKGIPFFKENDTYTATRVVTWFDGSPMDDSKVDGKIYLKHRQSGDYYLANLPNWGETFLQKPNVASLRNMSSTEILLLKMGYYKGVTLLGYYAENGGDTPAPIEYYLSDTAEEDDGGRVIDVGGVKLEHEFNGVINLRYYGCRNGSEYDNSDFINKAIESNNNSKIIIPIGETSISKTIEIGVDKQFVFEGEGRNSGNGAPLGYADGLSIITWRGLDPQYTSAIKCDDPTNTWCSFKNFHLNNRTDRTDIDGINVFKFIRGDASDLVVARFRNNFYIRNYCYYMTFYNCQFSYAKVNNVLITEQPNHGSFNSCKFVNSEQNGVKVINGQTGLSFNSCFFEQNKRSAVSIENTQVLNLNNCYFEQNGTQGDKLTSVIEVKYYDNSINVNTLVNITGAYVYFRDGIDFVKVISSDSALDFGSVIVSIKESEFTAKNFTQDINTTSAGDLSALVRISTAAGGAINKVGVILEGNGYIPAENGVGGILPIGGRPMDYKFFSANGCAVTRNIISFWDKTNINLLREDLRAPNINFLGQNGNTDTSKFIDFPELATSNGYINYGRNTNTTGDLLLRFYDSANLKSTINLKTGQHTVESIKLGQSTDNPTILYGTGSPEGVVKGGMGSIYIRNGFSGSNIYHKSSGNGNTGWVLLTPPSNATPNVKGLVNQATTSPDTAAQAAGATPTKEEFDALLAELRDLKNKMRTAGVLAT